MRRRLAIAAAIAILLSVAFMWSEPPALAAPRVPKPPLCTATTAVATTVCKPVTVRTMTDNTVVTPTATGTVTVTTRTKTVTVTTMTTATPPPVYYCVGSSPVVDPTNTAVSPQGGIDATNPTDEDGSVPTTTIGTIMAAGLPLDMACMDSTDTGGVFGYYYVGGAWFQIT